MKEPKINKVNGTQGRLLAICMYKPTQKGTEGGTQRRKERRGGVEEGERRR